MVWSKWSPAAVMMLACVGVTWSQTPVPTTSVGTGMLTIHENGKSLRCRIITNWSTPDGSKAYQLQTIDNGEMITIVEDEPATTLQEPLLAGKVKSLPMRIFHWGKSRVPPPGVPTPPAGVSAHPAVVSAPGHRRHHPPRDTQRGDESGERHKRSGDVVGRKERQTRVSGDRHQWQESLRANGDNHHIARAGRSSSDGNIRTRGTHVGTGLPKRSSDEHSHLDERHERCSDRAKHTHDAIRPDGAAARRFPGCARSRHRRPRRSPATSRR